LGAGAPSVLVAVMIVLGFAGALGAAVRATLAGFVAFVVLSISCCARNMFCSAIFISSSSALRDPEQTRCVSRLLTAWSADIAFVLDQLERLNRPDASGKFTGRLDMTRVGVFGHSFGGATAAQFCHDDSRCKAGINLDGAPFGSVIREGLHLPFLFVLSGQIHSSDAETRQVLANIKSIYDQLPMDGRLRIVIRGANHFLFSDDGALLKSHIVLRTLRMLGIVDIDGRRQLAVTAYCVHSFFDAYLKRAGVSQLQISSALYPEIQVLE
jgi:dienelactone hydrolase